MGTRAIRREDVGPEARAIISVVGAAVEQLGALAKGTDAATFVLKLRFESIFPGIGSRPANFQELLNQATTCLVILAGCEWIFRARPDVETLEVAWAEAGGRDIRSERFGIAAECYAAVDRENNNKYRDDLGRLRKEAAQHRYLFFYSRKPAPEREVVDGIEVIRVGLEDFIRGHCP